jgi:hypothetical protein
VNKILRKEDIMGIFIPTYSGYSRPWTREQIIARGIQKKKFAADRRAIQMAPQNKVLFNKEYPDLIEDLRAMPSKFLDAKTGQYELTFAGSLVKQFDDKGTLSEKQIGAGIQAAMRHKNKPQKADAPTIDLGNVLAMFSKAHEAIKTPKFRFDDLVISRAPDHGVNAGALYVKVNGDYAGKVKEGKWFGSQDILPKLQQISKDPLSSAVAYGRRTGTCACCGKELTVHESIERGIGPICAEKWGLL